MDGHTDVYLISGFLGSGKTTFLNRLVAHVPDDVSFLILMNEFGEVGLDGVLVEGEDLDMIEISKGSIFCACVKTDFIKALHEIATNVRPNVMLIETTGVANPSDLDRDLQLPIFGGAFRLRDKFCLIDAVNFMDTYESFLAIEKQLEASDVFIINKMDLADPDEVSAIKDVVRSFNAQAEFYEAVYADVTFDALFRHGVLVDAAAHVVPALSEDELDDYIDELLCDESAQVTPPDRLLSLVVTWPGGSERDFREWLDRLPAKVVRAKGLLDLTEGLSAFSLVNGLATVEPYAGNEPGPEVRNRLVFISRPEDIRALEATPLPSRPTLA